MADNGSGQLAVTMSGPGVWIISGANDYSGGTVVLGGTLRFDITSGSATIAAGTTATVAPGATLELAGSVSAFGSAGGNRTHVLNNSTASGLLVSGTNQVVGGIDGAGNTQVNAGSSLTADHIVQNALIIGGAAGSPATVTIDASDASGNALDQSSGLALAGSLAPNDPFAAGIGSPNWLVGAADSDSSFTLPTLGGSNSAVGVAAVPEPSTILLSAFALLGLLITDIRRRTNG
ncbi:MAG TPA: autotransporter-associated beta strand repeat-containing protein [Pirellulales bacterium]|nr:autotransporter-associated beta strand repeat-containing protein [Pirellulales bacterium]